MYRLRRKNLWSGNFSGDVSWTWLKLMKLRSIAVQFTKYRDGNGLQAVWHDNSHPLGPVKQRFGGRIIYDAWSTDNATMNEYVNQNGRCLPQPFSTDLPAVVNQLPSYTPNVGIQDSVEWILTPLKVYTCKSAWNAIRCVGPTVIWHKLVWGKDCAPRFSFIFRLDCWNWLRTKDLLYRCGKVADNWCVLCGNEVETRGHLFYGFRCFNNAISLLEVAGGTKHLILLFPHGGVKKKGRAWETCVPLNKSTIQCTYLPKNHLCFLDVFRCNYPLVSKFILHKFHNLS